MSVHLDRSATGGYAWGGCTPTDPNFYRAYHHRSEHANTPTQPKFYRAYPHTSAYCWYPH